MKVLLTKDMLPSDIAYIRERIHVNVQLVIPNSFNEDTLVKEIRDTDILLGSFFTRNLLENAINLKFIQVPWTGVENVNFELLEEFNITLCNSHSNSDIVAEHAIALMFDAAKKITYHDRLMRNGDWNRVRNAVNIEISPFSAKISGKTIGILGFGSIGRKIYKMLSGFNCTFIAYGKEFEESEKLNQNIELVEVFNEYNALRNADFLFITLPLTHETRNLVDESFIKQLKKGVILVNISRGEIIDEKALFDSLLNKHIGFAAIDTWFNYAKNKEGKIFPSLNYEFHKLNNIVLSPHRAGYIEDGYPHLDDAIDNINNYSLTGMVKNIVSLSNRY